MKKLTNIEIIEKFKEVHGDKYDYSLVDYVNRHTTVGIICSEHGVFNQTPGNHLKGQDCPSCKGRTPYDTEKFVKEALAIHGSALDFSKVNYKRM